MCHLRCSLASVLTGTQLNTTLTVTLEPIIVVGGWGGSRHIPPVAADGNSLTAGVGSRSIPTAASCLFRTDNIQPGLSTMRRLCRLDAVSWTPCPGLVLLTGSSAACREPQHAVFVLQPVMQRGVRAHVAVEKKRPGSYCNEVPLWLSGTEGGTLGVGGLRERHVLGSASSEAPPFCAAKSDS